MAARKKAPERGHEANSADAPNACQIVIRAKPNARKTALLACETVASDDTSIGKSAEGETSSPIRRFAGMGHTSSQIRRFAGMGQTSWVVAIAAPPVEGAANIELCTYLAKVLAVPKSAVTVARGEGGRNKRLSVVGISAEKAFETLTNLLAVPKTSA